MADIWFMNKRQLAGPGLYSTTTLPPTHDEKLMCQGNTPIKLTQADSSLPFPALIRLYEAGLLKAEEPPPKPPKEDPKIDDHYDPETVARGHRQYAARQQRRSTDTGDGTEVELGQHDA